MKNFKKLMALVIAMVMVVGAMNAFAADAVGNRTLDDTLTISGLAEGDVVRFYQVFQESEDYEPGWVYTSDFAPMSSTNGVTVSQITGNPAANIPMSLTAAVAGQIAALTAGKTPVKEITVGTGETSAVWTNTAVDPDPSNGPAAGMYVAIITAADVDTVYNPVFVSADFVNNGSNSWNIVTSSSTYSNNAAAKKSTLEIKKSADTTEDAWDDEKSATDAQQENSQYTTAIGDTVTFTVNTTIPGYGPAAAYPSFEITDTMQDLTLVTDSVKVYNATTNAQITDVYETFNVTEAGYTIKFTKDYLQSLTAPLGIRIEYSAKVATSAQYNVNVENNTVKLKYSTNPSNSTDFGVKMDETNHYTFSIDANSLFSYGENIGKSGSELVKIGLDAAGNRINSSTTWSQVTEGAKQEGALQGATFRLYTNEACTNEYVPKKADGTDDTAVLYTSGADGRFFIKGLDAGTYYLKEISAPDGFIKHQEPVKIEIQKTIKDEQITKYYYAGTWYDAKADAEAAATAAGYGTNGIAVAEVVKEYTYNAPVLESYKILINDTQSAEHTFTHASYSTGIKWSSTESIEAPASIPNTQGVELPSTGGMGTTLFYAIGAILVLGAGILLVSKRRMAAN